MTSAELLDLWEEGQGRSSVERALTLAAGVAATDTLGRRNQRILALREALFGPRLDALAACPACGGTVELSFAASALPFAADAAREGVFARDGYEVSFRLPTSVDLAYLLRCADEADAERALLERCVGPVRRDGREVPLDDVPPAVIEALDTHMDDLDPGACHRVSLRCPDCGHGWSALVDVAAFTWREIGVAARATLRQVHVLAETYGWTEAEILRLSVQRRLLYLDLVRG